jgi:penicillin-binding protein 1A
MDNMQEPQMPNPNQEQPLYQTEWDLTPEAPVYETNPRIERMPKYKTWVKWMWRIAIGGVASVILFFFFLSFQDLPTFEELENPKSNLASQIYGANNEVIGRYYIENRVPVPYDSISEHLVHALIATEDERFYQHCGIDWEAIARVAKGLVTLNPQGGGSTISQQLAKLLYSNRDFRGMNRISKVISLVGIKFKEWITAVKLEKSYTKEEIIAMYFNQADFIYGGTGIRSAAEIYFGRKTNQLKIEEAAVLVGMLQNPSLHNPVKHPQNALNRRNIVFGQMLKNGFLKKADFDKLKVLPLKLNFQKGAHSEGLAAYFRMTLREEIQEIFRSADIKKADGSAYNIYKDGLKIYTTIDPVMQRHAEAAMKEHMTQLQKRFFTVWKGRDPWTDKAINIDAKLRETKLKEHIYESDRYQNLRSKYLDDIVNTIEKDIEGLVLDSKDIDELIALDKAGGVFVKLITEKGYTADKVAMLRKVAEHTEWKALKAKYLALEGAVEKDFKKAITMKVFSFATNSERDTIMSPLDSIKYHRMFLQLGSMAVDPKNGYVKAWVGGINHKYFQYDHCKSRRQVGSTFKPFVYATAIYQQGISPCMQIPDIQYSIHPSEGNFRLSRAWSPSNAKGFSGQPLSLYEGLKESANSISVYLLKQLGSTGPIRGLANQMGIDSSNLTPQPSICLGACDLNVLEMTGAYATFANNGRYIKPTYLLRVEDKNGKVLYNAIPEDRDAIKAEANYVMVDLLKTVTKGAPGISELKSEVGGKTGTTNNYVDGWFMGITPSLVVGTWVGGDDRWIRFLTIADGQGAKMARPYFAKFLKKLENDPKSGYDYNKKFKVPLGDLGITIDCGAYNKASTKEEEDLFAPNDFEQ